MNDFWRNACVAEAETGDHLRALLMDKRSGSRPLVEEIIEFDDGLAGLR